MDEEAVNAHTSCGVWTGATMEHSTATSNETTEQELSPAAAAAAAADLTGTATTSTALMPSPAAGDGNIEALSAAMAQLPPPSSTVTTAGGGAATATVLGANAQHTPLHPAFTHAHSASIPFGPPPMRMPLTCLHSQ